MTKVLPRKCLYCKEDAPYSPLVDLEIHDVKVYFCHTCKTEYLYWREGDLANHSIYTTVDSKTYRWTYAGPQNHLWYIAEPGEPGLRINKGMELLKSFPWDVETQVTPKNIRSKIKMLLMLL
jgi:hypothetical protein